MAAGRRAGELEERQDRAGRRALVAVVEVVDVGLVEVHGLLDEPQAERARVEVDVARSVAGDRRDVVQAFECHVRATVARRDPDPFPRPSPLAAVAALWEGRAMTSHHSASRVPARPRRPPDLRRGPRRRRSREPRARAARHARLHVRADRPSAGRVSVTGPTTIAENGDIAGFYTDAAGRSHGFVRDATTGAFTDVDVPGARDTYVLGLNAHGARLGDLHRRGGRAARLRARRGRLSDDRRAGRRQHVAGDVGVRHRPGHRGRHDPRRRHGGRRVGDAAGASHGFLLRPGQPRVDLDAPGASTAMDPIFQTEGGTGAIRSNARGDVVGYFIRAEARRRWRRSTPAPTACATGSGSRCCRRARSRRRRSRSTRRATSAASRSASTASPATAGSGRTARTSASIRRRCC